MTNNISPNEMNNNGWGVNPMGIGMNKWDWVKIQWEWE